MGNPAYSVQELDNDIHEFDLILCYMTSRSASVYMDILGSQPYS